MASTTPTPRAAGAAARSAPRSTKRGKVTRTPPRVPEDFFDPEAYTLLMRLLRERAARWQTYFRPPTYVHRVESAPIWGTSAQNHCPGTTLRLMRLYVLGTCLGMELERALRLLTMTWTEQNRTTEGNHEVEEWRLALAGVLWRIGQFYREFTRRKGVEAARALLEVTMGTLPR